MENNDYGLLYDSAVAWKELTEYYYVFTFGYKQQQPIDNLQCRLAYAKYTAFLSNIIDV